MCAGRRSRGRFPLIMLPNRSKLHNLMTSCLSHWIPTQAFVIIAGKCGVCAFAFF